MVPSGGWHSELERLTYILARIQDKLDEIKRSQHRATLVQLGLHNISQRTFYTKWDGQGSGPNNYSRDTSGVDTVHNAPSASPSRGAYVH